jgi:serine/threonine-protein kinase
MDRGAEHAPGAEDALLDLALQRGLVSREDLAAARGASSELATLMGGRFGPTLDALVALGLLQASQISALAEEAGQGGETELVVPGSGIRIRDLDSFGRIGEASRTFPVPDWDRYEGIEYISQGGMARVFRAQDPRLNRPVALKLLHNPDEQALRRFMQEARAQARVEHPHVCRIYEVGEVGGRPYIAMEFVNGPPIGELRDQMGREQMVRAILEVAEAVHAAHRLGLIHRDLKPANILVEKRDEGWWPVVLDFGLAGEQENHGLTLAGTLMGTPSYMAPEQARGDTHRLDRRTDVYALGATLFALLLGRPPIVGDGALDTVMKVMEEDPVRPRSLEVSFPEDLETIVLKCLEKEPQRRYDSARLLAEDLQRYLDGEPVLARPLGRWGHFRKRIRRNRTLSMVVAGSFAAVLVLGILAARAQLRARAGAQLAQRFGLESERLEGSYRRAQMLPLHDMRIHKAELRAWMRRLEGEMKSLGRVSQGPGHFALGKACLALGESREALRHLESAWRSGNTGRETAAALGLAHAALLEAALDEADRISNPRQKEARLAELERLHVEPALHFLKLSGTSSSLVQEGLIAFLEKRYGEALALGRQALVQDPWVVEAHLLEARVRLAQARLLAEKGDYEASAKDSTEALAEARQAGDLARSLVDAYILEGEARYLLMDVAIHEGRPWGDLAGEAMGALEKALQADPESADAHVKMARLCRRWADADIDRGLDPIPLLQKSLDHGREALRCSPDHGEAALFLAMTYRFLVDYRKSHGGNPEAQLEQGLVLCRKAIDLRPREAMPFNAMGNLQLSRAEYLKNEGMDDQQATREALAAFEEACRLDPAYSSPWTNRGLCLRRLASEEDLRGGNPLPILDRALVCYQSAIRLNPRDVIPQHNLAFLCRHKAEMELKRGMDPAPALEEARTAFRRALEINPSFAQSWGGLGEVATVRALLAWSRGADALPAFQEALAAHRKAVGLNANMAILARELGRTELDLARYLASQGRPCRGPLLEARKACEAALRINAREEEALLGLASVQLFQAPSSAALDQAAVLAAKAREAGPRHEAPLLLQGEIALRRAEFLPPAQRPPRLREADGFLKEAGDLAPRSPRLAVLLARRSLLEPGSRAQLQARAQEAVRRLKDAFQADRTLALFHGAWLDQAVRAARVQAL